MEDKGYSVVLGVKDDHVSNLLPQDTSLLAESESGVKTTTKPLFRWAKHQDITIKYTKSLTSHQCFLLGSFVPGFALKEKRWSIFPKPLQVKVDRILILPRAF
jgi:hypothetical protein